MITVVKKINDDKYFDTEEVYIYVSYTKRRIEEQYSTTTVVTETGFVVTERRKFCANSEGHHASLAFVFIRS
jgi:hypothetical protein